MRFHSKPRIIEAEQFFRDKPLPFRDKGPYVAFGCRCGEREACSSCNRCYVTTAHGQTVILEDGDWVIPEPSGPHTIAFAAYPVKPDIFAATYEPAEASSAKEG